MAEETKIGLREAYSVATPEDSIELYKKWAATYDDDFVVAKGYVAFLRCADLYLQHPVRKTGPVLDVGCGTGAVGVVLREGKVDRVDGIDISQDMLDQAEQKRTISGATVYTSLIRADLTKTIAIPDNTYAGIVSAGTFTHGHLGPESLAELWRVAAPGAICSIGVNAGHFDSHGFADRIADDVARKIIDEPDIHIIDTFSKEMEVAEDYSVQTMIVVCRVL